MICILALIVFSILGIFSASYRSLAKEAFDCVFKKLTFRKCDTGLDTRLKSKITGKLIKRSPTAAKIVYKHFEIFSWAFIILFVISAIYTGIGGYNYYLYGNCNGPDDDGFCVFDPFGENSKVSSVQSEEICSSHPPNPKYLTLSNVDLSIFPTYDRGAENTIIFIGCYACPYTRKSYPDIRKFMEMDNVNFVFAHFPVKGENDHLSNMLNSVYQLDKQKFIEFNDKLFELDPLLLKDTEVVMNLVEEIGLDREEIREFSESNDMISLIKQQSEELQKIGIYGTPTVFINGKGLVGPKPYRVYKRLLK